MVILTSDHGESLGEHGFYFDHADVYQPTIHVPLIIRYPKVFPEGKVIDALVQLIDIPYLILKVLGISVPARFQGRDLIPLILGEKERVYSTVYSNQGLWTAKRALVTDDGWKLIKTIDQGFWRTPKIELYNIVKDPGEENNLAEEERDLTDQLDLKMQRWLEENLDGKPDPLRLISSVGLPPVRWVEREREKFKVRTKASYEEWRKKMGY